MCVKVVCVYVFVLVFTHQFISRVARSSFHAHQVSHHKNLEVAGLTRKLLHKIAKERDEETRAEYMAVIQDCTGGQGIELVFIDEFSKNDHDTARRYGCTPSGQRADFIDNFVRGERYSTVAALTISGYDVI